MNDGGPAFPLDIRSTYQPDHRGMSLRDWFAGQALPVVMQFRPPEDVITAADAARKTAIIAYEFADAMLAEREKARDLAPKP